MPEDQPTTKTCSRCGQTKPQSKFPKWFVCYDCLNARERFRRHNPGTPTIFEARRASGVRTCSYCHIAKPFADFYGHHDSGRQNSVCKTCTSEYHKQYSQAHVEERRKYAHEYGVTHKEAISAKNKSKYIANPKPFKDRATKRYNEKRDQIREQSKDYYRRNEAAVIARTRLREARIENATIGDVQEIEKFYEFVRSVKRIRCYWCKAFVPKRFRHVDHIFPLDAGGPHATANLCCSCRTCNLRKHIKLPEEFSGQGELRLV